MKYDLQLASFYGSLWAIVPAWHATVESLLLERALSDKPDAGTLEVRLRDRMDYRDEEAPARPQRGKKSTAIVQLTGPIIPRASLYDEASGVASHQTFAALVRQAADDAEIENIILEIASPGGVVEGIDVSTEAVRYAASLKKTEVVTEGMLGSCAYWIASQAHKIYASPASQVGSIGVLAASRDISRMQEGLGVSTKVYRSGRFKALGQPGEARTEDEDNDTQRQVDELFAEFVSDVARGRGLTDSEVRDRWGDGAFYVAGKALKLGMIDEIGTMASVLAGETFSRPARRSGARAGKGLKGMEDENTQTQEGQSTPEATLTLEALMASHPSLVAQIQASTRAEVLRTAQASEGTDESTVAALERRINELDAQAKRDQQAAQDQRREAMATAAIDGAKLKPMAKVEGMDLEANFRNRLIREAKAAASDDEARAHIAQEVTAMKATVGSYTDETPAPRQRREVVASGSTSRPDQPERQPSEEKPVLNSLRRSLGIRA